MPREDRSDAPPMGRMSSSHGAQPLGKMRSSWDHEVETKTRRHPRSMVLLDEGEANRIMAERYFEGRSRR